MVVGRHRRSKFHCRMSVCRSHRHWCKSALDGQLCSRSRYYWNRFFDPNHIRWRTFGSSRSPRTFATHCRYIFACRVHSCRCNRALSEGPCTRSRRCCCKSWCRCHNCCYKCAIFRRRRRPARTRSCSVALQLHNCPGNCESPPIQNKVPIPEMPSVPHTNWPQ